ncbi:MAG: hypothetical protein UZ18_ATM001001246 [Armatimonadetes bacterium OLB18]|nr:MAG: hypothetical protein UZ18_ATM001001246 [Armatimonadetes bacterium OLB18]
MRRVRRTQRGGGLVLGLVVLTGLITLAVAFSVREHAEMRSIRNRIEVGGPNCLPMPESNTRWGFSPTPRSTRR